MVMQQNHKEGLLEAEASPETSVAMTKSIKQTKRNRKGHHHRKIKRETETHSGEMPSIFQSNFISRDNNRTAKKKTVETERGFLPKLPVLENDTSYIKYPKNAGSNPILPSNILPPINDTGSFISNHSHTHKHYQDKFLSFPIRHHNDDL